MKTRLLDLLWALMDMIAVGVTPVDRLAALRAHAPKGPPSLTAHSR